MKTTTPWRRRVLRLPIVREGLRLGGFCWGAASCSWFAPAGRAVSPDGGWLAIPPRDGPSIHLASAWGQGAGRYGDLRSNFRARVILCARLFPVDADLLDPVESGQLMVRYADQQPRVTRVLARPGGWVAERQPTWHEPGRDRVPWARLILDR